MRSRNCILSKCPGESEGILALEALASLTPHSISTRGETEAQYGAVVYMRLMTEQGLELVPDEGGQ